MDGTGATASCLQSLDIVRRQRLSLSTLLLAAFLGSAQAAPAANEFSGGRYSLQPYQLGVVVNDADSRSVEVADYYLQARQIPAKNLVHVRIPGAPRTISATEFQALKQQIEAQLDPRVQAVVLVWTAPYAVECNSITSAITLGFDAKLCEKTCAPSKPNRYFNTASRRPYSDFGMRLAMLLPVESVANAKALIDRGLRSDGRNPNGRAYLLTTPDPVRNSRANFFPPNGQVGPVAIVNVHADHIENRHDVMFYLTGLPSVPKLDTLSFLPGALADHLTSAGGDLLGSAQMSSLRWLDAGATASYGSVSEPCNHWQKFPNPTVLMRHYLAGASAIEAYWKSVAWPAQGVFIGEPLAAPFRR
jgi:uncharacterized protein (TIGR03790 family)